MTHKHIIGTEKYPLYKSTVQGLRGKGCYYPPLPSPFLLYQDAALH